MKGNIKIYCDGGARGNPGPAAAAFLVVDIDNKILFKKALYLGKTTNNVAEYNALKMALDWVVENKNQTLNEILIHLDSQLVIFQMKGLFKIKDSKLIKLATIVKELEKNSGKKINYINIPRINNKEADLLVNECLDFQSKS